MARLARTISSDRFRHFLLRKYGPILLPPGTHTKRSTTVLVNKPYTFRAQNEEQCFFVVLYYIYFPTVAAYRDLNDYYHGVYYFTGEYLGQQQSSWIFRFFMGPPEKCSCLTIAQHSATLLTSNCGMPSSNPGWKTGWLIFNSISQSHQANAAIKSRLNHEYLLPNFSYYVLTF
jgi:hypothetical protein